MEYVLGREFSCTRGVWPMQERMDGLICVRVSMNGIFVNLYGWTCLYSDVDADADGDAGSILAFFSLVEVPFPFP